MSKDHLPEVDPDLDVNGMIQEMRKSRKAAVIVHRPAGAKILTAEAILLAHNIEVGAAWKANREPARLTAGAIATAVEQKNAKRPSEPQGDEAPSWDSFNVSALQQTPAHYFAETGILVGGDGPVSRRTFGVFTQCICAGPAPRVHSFTPDMLKQPGVCNYPHAAIVTCS